MGVVADSKALLRPHLLHFGQLRARKWKKRYFGVAQGDCRDKGAMRDELYTNYL